MLRTSQEMAMSEAGPELNCIIQLSHTRQKEIEFWCLYLYVKMSAQSFFLGFLGFLLRDLALQRGQIGALRWICWWHDRHDFIGGGCCLSEGKYSWVIQRYTLWVRSSPLKLYPDTWNLMLEGTVWASKYTYLKVGAGPGAGGMGLLFALFPWTKCSGCWGVKNADALWAWCAEWGWWPGWLWACWCKVRLARLACSTSRTSGARQSEVFTCLSK